MMEDQGLIAGTADMPIGHLLLADYYADIGEYETEELYREWHPLGVPSLRQVMLARCDGGCGRCGGYGWYGGDGGDGGEE